MIHDLFMVLFPAVSQAYSGTGWMTVLDVSVCITVAIKACTYPPQSNIRTGELSKGCYKTGRNRNNWFEKAVHCRRSATVCNLEINLKPSEVTLISLLACIACWRFSSLEGPRTQIIGF